MHIVYFVSGSDQYIDFCRLSVDTVKRFIPEASIHLFTDLDAVIEGVEVHKIAVENPLMVQNTLVWRDFCRDYEGETVFLDPDVLVCRKPDLQFLRDLAFTWRDNLGGFSKRMPWNTGVVFARGGDASAKFFDAMVEKIKSMSKDDRNWYGNQLALADMIGNPDKMLVDRWRHERVALWAAKEVNGAYVSELPCDLYNRTPEGDEPLMGCYFVHLKGDRKHRMKPLRDQLVAA